VKELLPDELWNEVSILIPSHPRHPKGGNDFSDDRLCLRGIIFVLRSGIPWDLLPTDAFGVSGVTCWRRLRDWTKLGLWPAMHHRMLGHLEAIGAIDHSIGVVDSASVRAVFGGRTPEPTQWIGPSVVASGM
jgi:transposase